MIHASAALSSPAPGGGRPEVRYRLVPAAGFVLTLVLWPPSGLGQSTRHGTIVGYVSGQTGRPLEGIKVMASAPAQTGSAKIAYSDQKGAFRLRQSRPGTFELRFTGADLKTLVRRGILVTPGTSTEVRVVMEVEIGGIEEVRIVDTPPPARRWVGPVRGTESNAMVRRCHKMTRARSGRLASGEVVAGHIACWIAGSRSRRSR
jgi:hypothetical protein